MIDPKDPTAKSDAAIRSVLELKSDLVEAKNVVKSLEAQLRAVRTALHGGPKKPKPSGDAKKSSGHGRRGLPTATGKEPVTPAEG